MQVRDPDEESAAAVRQQLDLDAIKAMLEELSSSPDPQSDAFIACSSIPALVAEIERLRGNISAAQRCLFEALMWIDSGSDCADHINEALEQL